MASSLNYPCAEDVLDWATKEMQYHPQERFAGDNLLDADAVRSVCRGNLAPIWKFLVERVRSEKTVRDIRRNLIVHGKGARRGPLLGGASSGRGTNGQPNPEEISREEAMLERAVVQAEVARLQDQVADLERSLQQQMEDVAREEVQRDKDALEQGDQDFRIAALEAYRLQTSRAIELFRDCKKRLDLHIAHARSAKQSDTKAAPQQVFERHLATHGSTLEPVSLSRQQRSRGRVLETPVGVESGRQIRAVELSTSRSNSSSLASSSNTRSPTQDEDAGSESQGGGSKDPDRPYLDKATRLHSDKDPSDKARPPSNKAPLLETAAERQVREACEALSDLLEKRIAESVPEFRLSNNSDGLSEKEGSSTTGVNAGHASAVASTPGWRDGGPDFYDSRGDSPWSSAQQSYPPQGAAYSSDADKTVTYLGSDLPLGGPIRDVLGDLPAAVVDRSSQLLQAPQELLKAVASCTRGAAEALREETERIDIRGDAEKLRYKYENNKIVEDAHSGTEGGGARSALVLLRERQKAHIDQFMRTEEAYTQAEESRRGTEEVMRAILDASSKSGTQETSLELQVWAQERELAGAKAAIAVLESEAARLTAAKDERKRAEEQLRRKWQQIVEFDDRRFALEALHNDLRQENDDLAAAWESIPEKARAFSQKTIVPFGESLRGVVERSRDIVAREMEAFIAVPHRLLPPQMAETGTDADEALTHSILSEAVSGNVGAISTLQRARTAWHHQPTLQSSAATSASSPMRKKGLGGAASQSGHTLDKSLPRILQGLSFCHPEYASIAGLVSTLAKQLQEAETLSALVSDGRFAVDEASDARPELLNSVDDALASAAVQDEEMETEALPRIRAAVDEARFAIDDSERVKRLIHEWWEQPAATSVPWVTVDGESVATWLTRVRQLQSALRTKAELNQLERALDQR